MAALGAWLLAHVVPGLITSAITGTWMWRLHHRQLGRIKTLTDDQTRTLTGTPTPPEAPHV
jgi:hypothetical protein